MATVLSQSFFSKRSPRIRIAVESHIDPAELNQFWVQAGLPARELTKLQVALQHSLFCVTARTISDRTLIGFARASGDGVFNIAILDFIAMPTLNNPEAVKRQILERFKQETKRGLSQCALSIFATLENQALLRRSDFEEDPNGIKAMVLPMGLPELEEYS